MATAGWTVRLRGWLVALAVVVCTCAGFAATLFWLSDLEKRRTAAFERQITIPFQASLIDRRILTSGWAIPEEWGVWTTGPRAELSLPINIRSLGDLVLNLEADAFIAHPVLPFQRVTIEVNGSHIKQLVFERRRQTQSLTIPKTILRGRYPLRLAIIIETAHSPAELGISQDTRKLGLGLRNLTMVYRPAEIYDGG